ncbi:peptidoglycan DD-metalloendopeptidase family protein [Pseudomonas typographi]|uniref:peptidoglycan DD-metalloendopeptidase family protein n=1 Tax=Pseudomonas typographi TaxID=2715964 RepID=UPI00168435EA|nr:M23 family metallopeptidase [Pseudomonas typographi]MBD1550244.1 M23 family metallopeptidase [Pseudomonas typographi]
MPRNLLIICLVLASLGAQARPTVYKFVDANGVTTYTDKPTAGARVFVFNDRMAEHLERQVHLDVDTPHGKAVFSARNELYAPVQVQLRFSGLANVAGAPASVSRVVPPRSRLTLATLEARDAGQPMHYQPNFSYYLGDPALATQGYRYALPWLGGPFRISQGANGPYSHTGPKGRYAIDIAMPEGTPIVAARAGVVVKVENDQSGRGNDPAGNFVRVLHDDGTMAVYLHLLRGSVVVREGQPVAVGEALARSGNTGNSTGPHLHFVVQRNTGLALESIPYQFDQPVNALPNFAVGGR